MIGATKIPHLFVHDKRVDFRLDRLFILKAMDYTHYDSDLIQVLAYILIVTITVNQTVTEVHHINQQLGHDQNCLIALHHCLAV